MTIGKKWRKTLVGTKPGPAQANPITELTQSPTWPDPAHAKQARGLGRAFPSK